VMVKSNSAKWCEKCRKEKRLEGWRRSKEGAGRGDGMGKFAIGEIGRTT